MSADAERWGDVIRIVIGEEDEGPYSVLIDRDEAVRLVADLAALLPGTTGWDDE